MKEAEEERSGKLQFYSTVEEFMAELFDGRPSGKYSPLEVALWLDDLAGSAEKHLNSTGRAPKRPAR